MATTTNFGWDTPDDTDLVKDGAAAIRTALNGVDTSFVDLKGGTTGQVLSKTSGTDLDFTWINDASGMTNPMTTTGDVIYSSSGSTPARLGIGTANQVLRVNSGATAPEWATPSSPNPSYSLINTGGTTLTGTTTTISGISGMNSLFIGIESLTTNSTNNQINLIFNADTAANYINYAMRISNPTSYASTFLSEDGNPGAANIKLLTTTSASASIASLGIKVDGANSTGGKYYDIFSGVNANGTDGQNYIGKGIYKGTSTISSIRLAVVGGSSFDGGTVYVWGSAA